jgi:hypothetical protein
MGGSVSLRRIAPEIPSSGIRLTHLHRFAVEADPAWDTILLVLDRLLLGSEILSAFSLTFFLRAREDVSVKTAPTLWQALFLMSLCLFLSGVTLTTLIVAIRPGALENFAVEAAPPASFAISYRVLFGTKALPTVLSAILGIGTENLSIHTAPMTRLTTFDCVFRTGVTLTASGLTIGGRANVNYAVDAAVAPFGRETVMVATATVRTWKRPPRTMWRMVGTVSMRSGSAMPLIAGAVTFPPPAAIVLLPNPLTT